MIYNKYVHLYYTWYSEQDTNFWTLKAENTEKYDFLL